jgi:hypothetical protein
MRRTLAIGVIVLAGTIGSAQAATINFEDVAVAPGTEVFNSIDVISGGFLFDALNHSHTANRFWGTDNGGTHLVLDDFLGASPLTISKVGGAPFALTSLNISDAHSQFGSARQVEVVGNLFAGGTVTRLLALNVDIVDGVYGDYFETFSFDASWGSLSSIVLNGLGGRGGADYYAIDDIVVAPSTVPEPGILSLLGLGSVYLYRRRREKTT